MSDKIKQLSDLDATTLQGEVPASFADPNLSNVSDTTVLDKVKNVDGAGSGLDADTLQGKTPTEILSNVPNGGDVGSYVFASVTLNSNDNYGYTLNETISGSKLSLADVYQNYSAAAGIETGSTLSGTWKLLGYIKSKYQNDSTEDGTEYFFNASLFVRIA